MKRFFLSILLAIALLFIACNSTEVNKETQTTASTDSPQWAQEVIWYQIFVERFDNGDPDNDPTSADLTGSYPGFVPESWKTTPWTGDWYSPDPWFKELEGKTDIGGYPMTSFGSKIQLRRYGGDLQGVLDRIEYLDSLGITAVYFNPLNDAPSLHKYDARNWRHIDRNFGPDPEGDVAMMAQEIPDDPSTWKMTAADKMFVQVLEALHEKGIRVILDYSWNHTGMDCWAFNDVKKNGENSKFADWYWIDEFDNPETAEDEFAYRGWLGVVDLPEIKETVRHTHKIEALEGDIYSNEVKQHIFNVTKRWMDPNNDGDPSDGVDGFRLDVAAEVPLGFWREYRSVVRNINPEAYLIGEVWWEEYPDKLLDPAPFLEGDIFDAVMNYRWYREARHLFAAAPDQSTITQFTDSLERFASNLRKQNNYAMMNVVASHDAPRVSTSLFNKNKYKFQTKPDDNPAYKIHKPDQQTYNTLKMLLVHQFTWFGAPHIWNGDEMGMWGSDDPDTRKPLLWYDKVFDDETIHPNGLERPVSKQNFDHQLFDYYQKLIALRKANPVLANGDYEFLIKDDNNMLLAYSRYDEKDEVITLFNLNEEPQAFDLPVKFQKQYTDLLNNYGLVVKDGRITMTLPGRSAAIVK